MQDLEAEIHALEDGKDPLLPGLHSLIPPSQPENNIHIYFKWHDFFFPSIPRASKHAYLYIYLFCIHVMSKNRQFWMLERKFRHENFKKPSLLKNLQY